MLTDATGGALWDEPLIGDIFGRAYYERASEWHRREWEHFALNDAHKEAWLGSMRAFVLDGARSRFPGSKGPLIVKEPNGVLGVRLISEAMPQSGFVFLVRDPRDVIASLLDFNRRGGHLDTVSRAGSLANPLADEDPEAFVAEVAHYHAQNQQRVGVAYGDHPGPKVTVRYEDLRGNPETHLGGVLSALGMSAGTDALRRAVRSNAWENVPKEKKGAGKFYRRATPGGWREDLTPEQASTVESIVAPLLVEFYPET